MKKSLQIVLRIFLIIIGLGYNFCYADEIDPMFPYKPSVPVGQELDTVNIVPMIIIGIIVAVIVISAIMVLIKTQNKKEKKDK